MVACGGAGLNQQNEHWRCSKWYALKNYAQIIQFIFAAVLDGAAGNYINESFRVSCRRGGHSAPCFAIGYKGERKSRRLFSQRGQVSWQLPDQLFALGNVELQKFQTCRHVVTRADRFKSLKHSLGSVPHSHLRFLSKRRDAFHPAVILVQAASPTWRIRGQLKIFCGASR